MAPLIFQGRVVTGSGHYSSDLRFPGRDQHLAAPPDWPETICQGSLNIKVQRYPREFLALVDPPECTSSDQSGPMSLFCKRDFSPVNRSTRRV